MIRGTSARVKSLKMLTKNHKIMNDIIVDFSITPENCESRGYEWYKDSIYDPGAPSGVNAEFMTLITKGWILGEPGNRSTMQNGGIGLYKPIAQTSGTGAIGDVEDKT